MEPSQFFFAKVIEILNRVSKTQQENIDKASELVANCIKDERTVHIWGPGGHSAIIAEEALYRKGGLACVNPIYDPCISLSHGALKEINGLERVPGLAKAILSYNRVKKGDVLILGSAYGVNMVVIEGALEAKRLGAQVIAITSSSFSKSVAKDHPVRHPSKKNLYEIAHIVIDSFVPPGDAVVEIEGVSQKVAPLGTIIQISIYQALVACVAKKLLQEGIQPPIWTNALKIGGLEANREYINKYYGKVKSL